MVELGGQTGIGGPHIAQVNIPALAAASTADEVVVWKNNTGRAVTISQAGYLPDEALTGADTNSVSLQFKSKTSAGAASKNITAVKPFTSGVDMVKFVQNNLVLSTTVADLVVQDDETVTLDITKPGTGLALPAGIGVITYRFEG